MPTAREQELFEKHCSGKITREEWNKFRVLLEKKYKYGDEMPEYPCPKCGRPLLNSWYQGLVCWKRDGGCGWSPPFGSPFTLTER
jgi:hypothetical protein